MYSMRLFCLETKK